MKSKVPGPRIKRPRRNLRSTLIEPFKQIKLGLYVVAITMAFVTVAAIMFVAAFTEQYTHVMNIFQVVDPNLRWELVTNDVFYTNAIRLIILFGTFVAVMMGTVFRMTHRIYGPLVSIERFVSQMTEGQYNKRVTIRQNDEMQRLAKKLNEMAVAIERRHGAPIDTSAILTKDEDQEDGDSQSNERAS